MQKFWQSAAALMIVVGIANCAPKSVGDIRLDLNPALDLPPKPLSPTRSWGWTSESWKGNDIPYQHIRREVNRLVAKGESREELLERQKIVAQQHPNNTQAQFAWGYVAYTSLPQWAGSYVKMKLQRDPAIALERLQGKGSYNYTRLRFLLPPQYDTSNLVQIEAKERLLEGLGQRLLQHDPNDLEVKYQLNDIDDAILERNPTDNAVKSRALRFARELIQAKPKVSRYRTLTGGTHIVCWTHTNNPADAQAAIASYQDYLRVAPQDEEFRPQAENLIKVLQEALAHPK